MAAKLLKRYGPGAAPEALHRSKECDDLGDAAAAEFWAEVAAEAFDATTAIGRHHSAP